MKTGSYRFRKQKSREVLLSAFAILSCSDDISDVFLFLSCSAFPCRLHCWASWPPNSGRNSHQLLSFYIPPAERESLFFEGFSLVLRLMGIDSDGLKPPLLASATWVRRCSGTYPGPLTYLSHSNHMGRKGQGCCGGKSRQVSAPTLHRSFLRCGTFCMRCYLWTIQPSVRVWCSHLGTSYFHSCSAAVFKDVPSLLFWSPRRKKEFFCSYRIFLWLLKMYHFLLSYCIPPSLICFPKPLALVALSTNNKIQRCDTLPPPWLLPSIWDRLASVRVRLCLQPLFHSWLWASITCWSDPMRLGLWVVGQPLTFPVHAHSTHLPSCTQTQMGPETVGTVVSLGALGGDLCLPGCLTEVWVWSQQSWGHRPEPFICHEQDLFIPLIKLEIR